MNVKLVKNRRVWIFSAVAVFIALILGAITFLAISFMGDTINNTLSAGLNNLNPVVRFHFDRLREIGLIKD